MIHNVKRKVIRPSRPDPGPRPAGELGVLFDQSPIAMVFSDRDLRTRRTNAAFRRLAGLPAEALTGRRPSETDPGDRIMDTALIEHALAEQVISRGVPVVDVHLESTMAGERRVFSWSAYRVTDNGQVLGVLGSLTDITGRVQAVTALRQANARLDLLQRAGSQIGTPLDVPRTAGGLAALALPPLPHRIAIDLCDQVLQGEDPPRAGPGALRFRRVAVRDAATWATVSFAVGDLITAPVARWPAVAFLQGKPLLARNPAEISRQLSYAPGQAEAIHSRGVHAAVTVPLTARGVTLGVATFARAQHPQPYGQADVRLGTDLASRAAAHIDNARLYTREHDTAGPLPPSPLPRHHPPRRRPHRARPPQPARP